MSGRSAGRRLAVSAVGVAAAVALAGCASLSGTRAVGDTSYVAGDGSTVLLAVSDRAAAPGFAGTTLDGTAWDLTAHRGTVVVLNVWASWCPPCRAEAPALARTAAELAPRGVQFVGVDTRDSATGAAGFVSTFHLPYPSVVDSDGRLQLAFRDALPIVSIPTTLVIDRQGRVAARALGEVDRSRLLGMVEPLLREPSASGGTS